MKSPLHIHPEAKLEANSAANGRVLIVDDEMMNLKLFKAYLASESYHIITAENGRDALLEANTNAPDVILLDIMMPDIDGFEVARRLKKNVHTAGIPIIMVTALTDEESHKRGLAAGADEFLTKPVHKAELVARVASMLRLKRFQEQLRGRQQSEIPLGNSVADKPPAERDPTSTLLIVEDDDRDALLIMRQIESEPYIIKRVTSGEAALREALNEPVDLILLDILLPGMDGFKVCSRLKGDDRINNTQIIMLTSLRDLDYRIQGTELGADDYLVKPVDARELKARVKALLKKKRYIDQLQNRYEKALNRAISDELTGLFNHGYFKRFLELEIKRSLRQKHPISLLLLDLDDFKQINDQLGHLAGDRILIQVANRLREKVRDIDFVARYGGEEFAVILPYTSNQEARQIAERLRRAISMEITVSEGTSAAQPLSASIGIAFCPDDSLDAQRLIRKADEMMYLAKQCGKNQVCISSDYRG
jgi:two-component system cell cycle response regulator